jgi:hypothetical protein
MIDFFNLNISVYLIGFLGILLFLFLLGFIFYREQLTGHLKLYFIIFKHGRYSYEFIHFFKEKDLLNPHNTCLKDELILHFMAFIREIPSVPKMLTEKKIEFPNVSETVTEKKLRKIRGKPDCYSVFRISDSDIQVVGYYDVLKKDKVKILYFFINGSFVMGEYLFPDVSRIAIKDLIHTISANYLQGYPIDGECFYIKDQGGNLLNFNNELFYISVKYLSDPENTNIPLLQSLFLQGQNTSRPNDPGSLKSGDFFKWI